VARPGRFELPTLCLEAVRTTLPNLARGVANQTDSASWGKFPQPAFSFFRFHLPHFCRCFPRFALHFRDRRLNQPNTVEYLCLGSYPLPEALRVCFPSTGTECSRIKSRQPNWIFTPRSGLLARIAGFVPTGYPHDTAAWHQVLRKRQPRSGAHRVDSDIASAPHVSRNECRGRIHGIVKRTGDAGSDQRATVGPAWGRTTATITQHNCYDVWRETKSAPRAIPTRP